MAKAFRGGVQPRLLLAEDERRWLAAAAALRGMTCSRWVKEGIIPVARRIVAYGPLEGDSPVVSCLSEGGVRPIQLSSSEYDVLAQAARIQFPKARTAKGMQMLAIKHLMPLAQAIVLEEAAKLESDDVEPEAA